jgi:hypothetical protein
MSCGGYGGLYGLYGLFDSSARDRAGFRLWFLGDGAGAGLRGWMRGVVGEGEDGLGDLCVGGRGLGVLCVDRTRGRGPGLFERSGWEAGFGEGGGDMRWSTGTKPWYTQTCRVFANIACQWI